MSKKSYDEEEYLVSEAAKQAAACSAHYRERSLPVPEQLTELLRIVGQANSRALASAVLNRPVGWASLPCGGAKCECDFLRNQVVHATDRALELRGEPQETETDCSLDGDSLEPF